MDAQPLVGIDPEDTQDVCIGGATFTLGVIDAGLWARIADEAQLLFEAAQRRAIRRCAAEGLDPEERIGGRMGAGGEVVGALPRAAFMAQNDPEFRPAWMALIVQALRLSLRGHSGFVNRKGEPFPFERTRETVEGMQLEVATPKTLAAYRVNPRVLYELWIALQALHTLGVLEKKDSPPPPSATG